jgi:hypothetical protein
MDSSSLAISPPSGKGDIGEGERWGGDSGIGEGERREGDSQR